MPRNYLAVATLPPPLDHDEIEGVLARGRFPQRYSLRLRKFCCDVKR